MRKEVEKIETSDQSENKGFPLNTVPDSAEQTTLSTRDIETMSIKVPAKTLVNLVLDIVFSAVGGERIKPKAHSPYDALSEINQCYLTGNSMNDPFTEIDSTRKDNPLARYHGKELFLGYRWRF